MSQALSAIALAMKAFLQERHWIARQRVRRAEQDSRGDRSTAWSTGSQVGAVHLGFILLVGLWKDLNIVKQAQRKHISQGLSPVLSVVQLSWLQIQRVPIRLPTTSELNSLMSGLRRGAPSLVSHHISQAKAVGMP